ncbi:hypothetical protein [Mesobacillus boroniphilus]|uniref:Uncharacterized protein n=1 Tax=Mesobacillus boroniphilus JCM 21738 TaxID=1294265 RepID=W4RRK6_9BACI|nr:hypothetical protein [Mesobacillus boroniphilus]GAE46493.1 hypothetical protein JCM21738_3400 [Mesobacillus boroniphilus JCM 21738]
MAKRKAERNALAKYTNTPKKNLQESEFSAEFAHGEDPANLPTEIQSRAGKEDRDEKA